MPWNQLWLSLKHMMVVSWPAMDGSYCLLGTSEITSFIQWGTMWWPGRKPESWSVMLLRTWLGLVKVLCPNKAPRIKRQVASVSKKAKEPSDSNNSNSLSGSEHPPKVKYFYNNKITTPQHPPKAKYTGTVMVKEQQYESPTSKPCSHRRRRCRGRPAHREEEDQVDNTSVKFQTSQTNNSKVTSLGGRQSVLPRQISTPSQSEIKSISNNRYCSSTSRITTPSQSKNSGFLPKRQYYQPQDDEDTYVVTMVIG